MFHSSPFMLASINNNPYNWSAKNHCKSIISYNFACHVTYAEVRGVSRVKHFKTVFWWGCAVSIYLPFQEVKNVRALTMIYQHNWRNGCNWQTSNVNAMGTLTISYIKSVAVPWAKYLSLWWRSGRLNAVKRKLVPESEKLH